MAERYKRSELDGTHMGVRGSYEIELGKTLHPCKYAEEGCDVSVPTDKIAWHQLLCHYAPLNCPSCKQSYPTLEDVVDHCTDVHGMKSVLCNNHAYLDLEEYTAKSDIKISLHEVVFNVHRFYVKVTWKQLNDLRLKVCCERMNLHHKLDIEIYKGKQVIQQLGVSITEYWNLFALNSRDHATTIHLNTSYQQAHDTTEPLNLCLKFNDIWIRLLKNVGNFRKDFECPICLNFMVDSIYECPNRHNICGTCKEFIVTCPICRENMGDVCNTHLEYVLTQLQFCCTNREFGCLLKGTLRELKVHELQCDFQLYTCHYDNCEYEGDQMRLMKHYKKSHDVKRNGSTIVGKLDHKLNHCFIYKHHVFLLQSFRECNDYALRVTLVNNTAPAWEFIYSIGLVDEDNKELMVFNNSVGKSLFLDTNLFNEVCRLHGEFRMRCSVRKPCIARAIAEF